MAKKLIVANPRNIPQGHHIISYAPRIKLSHKDAGCEGCDAVHEGRNVIGEWYEGDEFEKPKEMAAANVTAWIKGGFLVESD
tara:strand:+ start:213 stop:458 length:246 start_codon:yes stop_codon:yes gene_type:complete